MINSIKCKKFGINKIRKENSLEAGTLWADYETSKAQIGENVLESPY